MKRIIAVLLMLSLLVTTFALISCSSHNNDADTDSNPVSDSGSVSNDTEPADNGSVSSEPYYINTTFQLPCVYDDYVFFFDTSSQMIEYQIITAVHSTGISIISDPLASGEDSPLSQMVFYYFLVDVWSSDNNGYSPILLIACYDYSEYDRDVYKVISYDLSSNTYKVLVDDIYNPFQSFALYGEYIIFTTQDGDEGYNIHCVKTDGSDYVTLDNPDCDLYRVRTVSDDTVYFTDSVYHLYSAPLDLSEKEYLCDIPASYVSAFVEDGYLIYCGESESITIELEDSEKTYSLTSADLCRKPLSDLSAEAEVLTSSVNVGRHFKDKFYYYIAENREGTYYLNTDTLYVYSFDTMTSEVVWTKEGAGYYAAFSDKYIIYEDVYPNSTCYVAYNIATGEATEVPY